MASETVPEAAVTHGDPAPSETAGARRPVGTAALRHSTVAHRHSAEMAASDAATAEASSAESASAAMESASTAMESASTATTAAAMECHRAGRHRRRADRKGSSERKNLSTHRSLSFLIQGRPTMRWAWPSRYLKCMPVPAPELITNC
jgi:hypothetical protein